jgi:hypothetical protein
MYAALLVAFLGVSLSSSPSQPQDVPLVVVVDQADQDNGVLYLRVTNQSPQAITAWSVEMVSRLADGHTVVSRYTQDFYQALIFPETASLPNGVMAAGESRVVKIPLNRPSVPVARLTVMPAAVVFDDQTSVGDVDRIQQVFRDRQKDLAAIKQIASTTLRVGATPAELNRLDDDLTTPLAADQRNVLGENARQRIRHIVQAFRRGTRSPEESAQAITQMVALYLTVVERQATPRQ